MPDASDARPAARQKEIFLAALELGDVTERTQFLDSGCGGDAAMREKVERLLRLEQSSRDFLVPPPIPAPGQAVEYFGDYVLLDEVARGASGVVFRARQSSLNRIVALKMLRDRPLLTTEAETRRFRAEAEAAASLDHPHIIPIYEVGAHEGQAYFSMKLVEGGTLQSRTAEFTDPRKAVALMVTVARAVHYAHGRGLLHRDLKPGNILLGAAGEPYVTDFGLARKYGMDSSLTVNGQIMGTPHYMAPEQARGENRDLTPAADVYSLGAMLYELLGRRKPFAGEDLVALLQQVIEAPPPPLRSLVPALDRDLETVVMRCLEKLPADRYASAAEFADDLERWLCGEPVKARPAGRIRRLVKWTKRRPAHAALAGLAALFVFTAAALLWPRPEVSIPFVVPPPQPSPAVPAIVFDPPLGDAEAAANRRAAEWLLATGDGGEKVFPLNQVRVRSLAGRQKCERLEDLPAAPWFIEHISFDNWDQAARITPQMEDEFIRVMQPLTRLKTFELRRVPCHSRWFAFLAANPALEVVSITHAPIDDAIFDHLTGLQRIRQLSLGGGPRFTGSGLARMACLPVLEDIVFSHSPVTDEAMSVLQSCGKLTYLNLDTTSVTDATARTLRGHPRLRSLSLVETGITDAALADLGTIGSLAELSIGKRLVTPGAVAQFREAYPRCKVTY
jgi:tRNA A-37 threonylcarbamoyl transferase component Bud32